MPLAFCLILLSTKTLDIYRSCLSSSSIFISSFLDQENLAEAALQLKRWKCSQLPIFREKLLFSLVSSLDFVNRKLGDRNG